MAQILGKLGVTGRRYDELIALASGADESLWLATTVPQQRAQLAALLDFERTASAITDVSPLLVPGLLQTGHYTRAVMIEGEVPPEEVSTRVAIRAGRREVLTRSHPVPFTAYIGEAALRQRIGSREGMAEQLAHLLDMARYEHVEIRVLTFDSGWHAGLEGPALLIEPESGPTVAHLEVRDSRIFLHTEADVPSLLAAVKTGRFDA